MRRFVVVACPRCRGIQPVKRDQKTHLCPYCGRRWSVPHWLPKLLILKEADSAREVREWVSAIKARGRQPAFRVKV